MLRGHLADVFDGLATGLVGDGDSPSEGMQIEVATPAGPALGAWQTVRDTTGDLEFAPAIHPPRIMRTTVRFPDRTGGPRTTEAVLNELIVG